MRGFSTMVPLESGGDEMNKDAKPSQKRRISLETAHELSASDLSELCDATEEAITSGGGFG